MPYTTEARADAIQSATFPHMFHVGDQMAMLSADWKLANRLAGVAEEAARDAIKDRRTNRPGAMLMVRTYKDAHKLCKGAHARFFDGLRASREAVQ